MSEIEIKKQPLWKKIELVIMILVLVAALLCTPAKLLAVEFTNKGTQPYKERKSEEAMAEYERGLRFYTWFKPARNHLGELEEYLKQKAKRHPARSLRLLSPNWPSSFEARTQFFRGRSDLICPVVLGTRYRAGYSPPVTGANFASTLKEFTAVACGRD